MFNFSSHAGGPQFVGCLCDVKEISLTAIRLEVSMAVTLKNAVFWEIKPNSYLRGDTICLRYIAHPFNAM
jgi:hypothetical protein